MSLVQNKTLSLIIPCYNEEKTLANIVERCIQLIPPPPTPQLCSTSNEPIRLELIIVNDC
ncbi:MAG: glycosyltransferase, partial [Spirochaetaceae bacterium]|nr:glycosyltransferase [Spirochaetaceae bacterium]